MHKTLLASALLTFLSVPAAFAQDLTNTCTDETMAKVEQNINAMTDPAMATQKDTAMKEFMAAQEAKTANNMDICSEHIGNIMEAMKAN